MTELTERLNRFENRLHDLEAELTVLRGLAAAEPEPAPAPEPAPEPQPLWELIPVEPAVEPPVEPLFPASTPRPRREVDLSPFLGARALAWTGGTVMLLGIVFFFVLAVERGWIGPVTRVTLGALASGACVAAGIWLQRRYGGTYASLAAAGVGIAGFYTTLLAATALYDLVPRPAALVAAAAIAATGAALAVRWRSQTLASFGLLGANLVPVPIALQDGHVSTIGTAFGAIVLAGTIAVAVPRDWRALLTASFTVTIVETLALAAAHRPDATAVAVAVWLLCGAGAAWLALRSRLTYLPAALVVGSALAGGWSAAILYDGDARGVALLVVGAAYGAASIALFRRDRDVASLLWAVGLTLGALAAASLLSGLTLTAVWAAEAAALAWLARRIVEPRFQLASLAWLGLAALHGLAVDAPPTKLFVENGDTGRAALSVAALAAASALLALCTFTWQPRKERILTPLLDALRVGQERLRNWAWGLAAGAGLYASSLAVVTIPASWDWGHVAVAGVWAVAAVATALARSRRAALVVLAGAVSLVVDYDLYWIREPARWWAFGIVAAAALVVAVERELRSAKRLEWPSAAALGVSVGLASTAVAELLGGHARGAGLLALAAGYGLIGVALLGRRRDFASALGVAALGLAIPASVILLDGTWLVLAWAASCAALALLARYEERLVYGSLTYLSLALGHALAFEAQPSDVFVAHRHPGAGVPAVLLVLAAAAALGWVSPLFRSLLAWLAGALALYAATLTILEAFEAAGGGVDTAFQRGHTAVSALWGAVALALLVAGLKRAGRGLRLGGLALFGASLAKLFLYDLSFLSSVARALSFLLVGGVILVGGFFYQRLAARDLHSAA